MATLTIRRLDEADRDWLRRGAEQQGISMEEYVRRLIRAARRAGMRTIGDVLDDMNASLDAETRALLGDPPSIERLPLCPRDSFAAGDDDAPARAAG